MSAKYTAWNGQPYPWPPPEGWYEAADGRWWAPGYGPDDDDDQETVLNKPRSLSILTEAAGPTAAVGPLPPEPATEARPEAARAGLAESELKDADGRSRAPLVAAGVMMALLLAAGLGYLAVRDDGTSTALGSPTTTVIEPISPTTAPPLPPTTLLEDAPSTTQRTQAVESAVTTQAPGTQTTVASSSASSTTVPPSTVPPTTLPPTSSDIPNSVVVPTGPFATDAERVAGWQDVLAQAGIDSGALSNADIIAFGNEFCTFVMVSEDLAEFNEYRNRALSAITGELTESELSFSIDAAVLVFCPEDAQRVGISLP